MSDAVSQFLRDLPRTDGPATLQGSLKSTPDCFVVEELLDVELSHDGEFDWLWIEKRGENTAYVAEKLAHLAGVHPRAVTYSGLKDRHALTRQWFCIHRPGKRETDYSAQQQWQLSHNDAGWRVLQWGQHQRKLRPGSHRGNAFELKITGVSGDLHAIPERIDALRAGIPNYFGEQRFGHNGGNIWEAQRFFNGETRPTKGKRGIYISSARSLLFNAVLAERIAQRNWNKAITGDIFCLRDSNSVFRAENDSNIHTRINDGDIHPSGPLYGRPGKLTVTDDTERLEQEVFSRWPDLTTGLARQNLSAERRSLRVIPQGLEYQFSGDVLSLRFSLPRGCFATALVRELLDYQLV